MRVRPFSCFDIRYRSTTIDEELLLNFIHDFSYALPRSYSSPREPLPLMRWFSINGRQDASFPANLDSLTGTGTGLRVHFHIASFALILA
ncbi:hypothetical protein BJX63DRAFT_133493 [Aspergillus granulosus]|uniref:Uncharacterized protein n=1 Tax=Aspergillus granulosus TaxID=176169 RepID=A0ABR4GSS2_9EURO